MNRQVESRPGWLLLVALLLSSCLSGWDISGRYACNKEDVCPSGFTCDEGVCCVPGGSPTCPTLPLPGGGCATGEAKVYFQDADGDGDGNEKLSRVFCAPPSRREGKPVWVSTGSDCDDTRADIFFGAPELCNGKDDNCDRVIDEGLPNLQNFYRDEDGDGVGDTAALVPACMAPPGYSALPGDCAPLDPSKFPGAAEQCNNLDDDCDGVADTAETGFVDSDDGTTTNFPCADTTKSGICVPGTFRCQVQGSVVRRQCVPLRTAGREVCDGLDNDCNGVVDQAPACGGPRNLLGQNPAITYRAKRLTNGNTLTTRCQANEPGTATNVSPDGRVWSGGAVLATNQYYHVWSAEVPSGAAWDLSRLNAQLRIAFNVTNVVPYTGTGGNWGTPPPFNPVVYLCGDTDTDFMRYRINTTADAFDGTDTSFDQVMPLNNSSSTWIAGAGSGFDTSRVRRVEILTFAQSTDFTLTFQNTTGFGP